MEYKYQFHKENHKFIVNREAADPSMIYFNDKYFIYMSMTAGFLVSENLINWSYHPLENLPIYDYAPDVRVIGEYMYFTASKFTQDCSFYRTKDPIRLRESMKKLKGHFHSGIHTSSSMMTDVYISIGAVAMTSLSTV